MGAIQKWKQTIGTLGANNPSCVPTQRTNKNLTGKIRSSLA